MKLDFIINKFNRPLIDSFLTPLITITATIIFLFSGPMACSKKSSVSSSDFSSNENTTGDIQPSKSYLWLHHKAESGALRYTHKAVTSGTWPDLCKVDLEAADPAERDIMCITESTELDLMFLGMNLEYNVPAHAKCPYVITSAPYFFRYEPPRDTGTANPPLEPANVTVTDNQVTGVWGATATYADGTTPNPFFTSGSGEYTCGFDYSKQKPAGPNCCQGYYNLRTITTTTDGTTTTNSRVDWNGNRAYCLAGPAMTLNPPSDSGFPMISIWRMKEQLETMSSLKISANRITSDISLSPLDLFKDSEKRFILEEEKINFGNFEVSSLINQKFSTTRFLANYTTGTTPRPFTDILDYYSFEAPPGYDALANYADPRYFTVLCTDKAHEVTARIRLQIREWNTEAALKLATEPTTAQEDDVVGDETDFPEFPNHDFYDWEDTTGLIRWNDAASTAGYPARTL